MSKYLLEPFEGGKVTVQGLGPEVLLAGSTVTVKQGNKVVEQVEGVIVLPPYNGYLAATCFVDGYSYFSLALPDRLGTELFKKSTETNRIQNLVAQKAMKLAVTVQTNASRGGLYLNSTELGRTPPTTIEVVPGDRLYINWFNGSSNGHYYYVFLKEIV